MSGKLEKLKHDQYVAEMKLTAAKHKEKQLVYELKRLTRSERIHRLCTRAGMLEKFLRESTLLIDDDVSYNGIPTSKYTLPRALEKLAGLAGVHRIKIHALRHSHAFLLISMGENPLLIKERLGHEKIQTTLGTYGHLYPNTNLEVAKKLTGILNVTTATHSIADYTSNQHTAVYHREVE